MSKLWKDHYKLLAVKKYWFAEGEKNEKQRIIEIIESRSSATGREELIALIKGEPTECECDPCGNENCGCQGKRCDFCKSQAD